LSAARIQHSEGTGWSSGREALIDQGNATQLDALLIEGWVPGLAPPVELLVYYLRGPFRLIKGFIWKSHPQARKDPRAFTAEFRRGILLQPIVGGIGLLKIRQWEDRMVAWVSSRVPSGGAWWKCQRRLIAQQHQ